MQALLFDIRKYFEACVFEIPRANCVGFSLSGNTVRN